MLVVEFNDGKKIKLDNGPWRAKYKRGSLRIKVFHRDVDGQVATIGRVRNGEEVPIDFTIDAVKSLFFDWVDLNGDTYLQRFREMNSRG